MPQVQWHCLIKDQGSWISALLASSLQAPCLLHVVLPPKIPAPANTPSGCLLQEVRRLVGVMSVDPSSLPAVTGSAEPSSRGWVMGRVHLMHVNVQHILDGQDQKVQPSARPLPCIISGMGCKLSMASKRTAREDRKRSWMCLQRLLMDCDGPLSKAAAKGD
jgi:hypothetical protein